MAFVSFSYKVRLASPPGLICVNGPDRACGMLATMDELTIHLELMEDLVTRLVRHGCDAPARSMAAVLLEFFDRVLDAAAARDEDLERLVLLDVYPVVRRQLAAVAEGSAARLDPEWVARFAALAGRVWRATA
jgi:hypothetical protein